METVREFPHDVEAIENVFITMSDGCRLAARVWMPADADRTPVPAILEYIPYRKRDFKRARDELIHPYLAGHGYASVRVDLRGSGDSGGVLTDEYLEQELVDGEEILRWISVQPWCNGSVGMVGISWGGFNGLQLAARRPPELRAVVSICSTDDRYADDVHYMGGCLLGDNLSWASVMFGYNSLPPDPQVVGDDWRRLWLERLEGSGLWLDTWLRHQRRDDYWKHGSICEDYAAVDTPIMAVSGWADGYTNAVFRMMENLDVPRQALIGPWSHKYPHLGVPGPAIGFLQEMVRWWDYWLKDEDNGIMDEPMLRVYMQDSVPPTTYYNRRPGRWVGEPTWPSPEITERTYRLGRWSLADPDDEIDDRDLTVQSPLTVGLFAGKWCSYSATPDLPHDQREEDGGALVFESQPLTEDLEIFGSPVVELEVTSNRPVAMVAVRLSDTAPDDQATRVTYGMLNLTHRDSHEHPEPLEVGRPYRVRVPMNEIAHSFPAGHRLRLAISTSYWPLAWLPPQSTRLTVGLVDSRLHLPVRLPRPELDESIRFDKAVASPPTPTTVLTTGEHNWLVTRDLATDTSSLTVVNDDGLVRLDDIDLEVEHHVHESYSTVSNDFSSPRGEVRTVLGLRRGDWRVRTVTRTVLQASPTHFLLHGELDAYEGGTRILSRNWNEEIRRELL